MHQFMLSGLAVALSLIVAGEHARANSDDRSLSMQFELQRDGQEGPCGNNCRRWVLATGAITPDTPRLFETFAKGQDLRGVSIVLDSDGGSVLGAISLGRAIRRLGMNTTIGRAIKTSSPDVGENRVRVQPDVSCESMCAFVLLAGVERYVPPESRVFVHQIWLGDRRDDPTAATYSAEDLLVVQRDIGRLGQYTMEMGGSIDLLALALKIPPWEPMHLLSNDELRSTGLVTADNNGQARISTTSSITAAPASKASITIGDGGWMITEKAGRNAVVRKHPLTVEGEVIGSFDVTFTCADSADQYIVTYTEERSGSEIRNALQNVTLSVGDKSVPLLVMTSSNGKSVGHESSARGTVPIAFMRALTEQPNRFLTVETSGLENDATVIRVGKTGFVRRMSELAASCPRQAPVLATKAD
jgi:hypothetical protein